MKNIKGMGVPDLISAPAMAREAGIESNISLVSRVESSAVQCSAVQYSILQCSSLQCSTVERGGGNEDCV